MESKFQYQLTHIEGVKYFQRSEVYQIRCSLDAGHCVGKLLFPAHIMHCIAKQALSAEVEQTSKNNPGEMNSRIGERKKGTKEDRSSTKHAVKKDTQVKIELEETKRKDFLVEAIKCLEPLLQCQSFQPTQAHKTVSHIQSTIFGQNQNILIDNTQNPAQRKNMVDYDADEYTPTFNEHIRKRNINLLVHKPTNTRKNKH